MILKRDCRYCNKCFERYSRPSHEAKGFDIYCSRRCASINTASKRFTPEVRAKISAAHKGIKHSWGDKISQAQIGRKHSVETIRKISEAQKGKKSFMYGKTGELSHAWRGGTTAINVLIRQSIRYRDWRTAVFERDNYICQHCGSRGNVQADHIKPLSHIIRYNSIHTLQEAYGCKELWDVNNGRTLCIPCHKKTPTYANKARLKKVLI